MNILITSKNYIMSHLSKIFTKIPVDIPNRSGFDMSHENCGTLKCGTLIPVLCEEVMPNETYRLGYASQFQLPPVLANFFGRIDVRFEAFFVPNRILWQGWQNFWTMPENNPYGSPVVRPTALPSIEVSGSQSDSKLIGFGQLSDYLGFKTVAKSASGIFRIPNALPFLAYHKIYDDFYRNTKVQKPVFYNSADNIMASAYNIPWFSGDAALNNPTSRVLGDGVNILSLRQRNWAKDYFTTASLYPQANGSVVGSSISIDTQGDTSTLSIGAIRSANVLQRWLERNNIAGERYADQVKAQFGRYPSDAFLDRPIFLGSDIMTIFNKGVSVTAQSGADGVGFRGDVGFQSANSSAFKDGKLIDEFTSSEHGYIMVLASIVPHAYYSTGTRRQLLRKSQGDFPIPLLQGLGEQAIYKDELHSTGFSDTEDSRYNIFGYQQQYAENKYHDDEVHGLLADTQDLDYMQLQRSFDNSVALTTDFIQIGTDALDNVLAATTESLGFSAWYDIYLSLHKVSPLSEYVIPTLGDLKNTHKETIDYRGKML